MHRTARWTAYIFAIFLAVGMRPMEAAEPPLYFGVLNQRSVSLTAEFWNPILHYISARSGVALELRMGRTAPETTEKTVRGEFAFAYTNHLFTPDRDRLGWRVIARIDTPPIRGQIVVPKESPIRHLGELANKSVVFPSKEAFVGYQVPMGVLTRMKIPVVPIFAGHQEGAMAQLKAGSAVAASVNERVLQTYVRREPFSYRVLWSSEQFHDIPVLANPATPEKTVAAVRQAFLGMANDPEGAAVLSKAAVVLKLEHPPRFVAATNRDYENYRRFYQNAAR